jgi:hypothetical protein
MTTRSPNEIGSETGETTLPERHIETLDDIPREIAEKRIQGEFGGDVSAPNGVGSRTWTRGPDHR